ncbi:MAG: hypothetical protein J6M24_06070 [Lachnospiraceae bacterium]|nr:hypothetical protein [Lachnospiraceae bacterium]
MRKQKTNHVIIVLLSLAACLLIAAFIIKHIEEKGGGVFKESSSKKLRSADIEPFISEFINQDAFRYAGSMLSGSEKSVYDKLLLGVLLQEKKIDIKEYKLKIEELRNVYACLRNDYPEIFWIGNDCEIYYSGKIISECLPTYLYDKDTIRTMISDVTQVKNRIITDTQGMNDYQKAMYIFEYIIDTTVYDSQAISSHEKGVEDISIEYARNVYGTLIKKRAICEGYSKTYQYLAQSMGIDCLYITGVSKNQGHAWNYVKLDGEWYGLDVTWCDPQGSKNIKSFAYCMLDEEAMKAGHESDVPYKLPECKGERYNYYTYNGFALSSFSKPQLSDIIVKAYGEGYHFVEFRCGSRAVYESFVKAVNDNTIFECFDGLHRTYGVTVDFLNYGLIEDALVVRMEL